MKDKKIMILVTMHRQLKELPLFLEFLKRCNLDYKPDICVYTNNLEDSKDVYCEILRSYSDNFKITLYKDSENTGYTLGLYTGLEKCRYIYDKYDFVIHTHADVFLTDYNKIIKELEKNESDIYVANECNKQYMTDFFVFNPQKIRFENYNSLQGVAEEILYQICERDKVKIVKLPRYNQGEFYPGFRQIDRMGIWHEHNIAAVINYLNNS